MRAVVRVSVWIEKVCVSVFTAREARLLAEGCTVITGASVAVYNGNTGMRLHSPVFISTFPVLFQSTSA